MNFGVIASRATISETDVLVLIGRDARKIVLAIVFRRRIVVPLWRRVLSGILVWPGVRSLSTYLIHLWALEDGRLGVEGLVHHDTPVALALSFPLQLLLQALSLALFGFLLQRRFDFDFGQRKLLSIAQRLLLRLRATLRNVLWILDVTGIATVDHRRLLH